MSKSKYAGGITTFWLGEDLKNEMAVECELQGLNRSFVARYLFKGWLERQRKTRAAANKK
jgi:hypothetical protein